MIRCMRKAGMAKHSITSWQSLRVKKTLNWHTELSKGTMEVKRPGVDKKTIRNLAKLSEDEYVRLVKKKFSNYHPRPVRREEIPKDNGKTRPLGIPAISDRIVQQCILQVMEPICEAKFSENSNGFCPKSLLPKLPLHSVAD